MREPKDTKYTDSSIACSICGNASGNYTVRARELMLGTNESFDYLRCGECGCMHLINPPRDMARYYPKNYYSFSLACRHPRVGGSAGLAWRKLVMRAHLRSFGAFGRLIRYFRPIAYPWLSYVSAGMDSRILDVGCGSGALLREIGRYGFSCLTGVDAFLPDTMQADSGLKLVKGTIHDIGDQTFDLIMYHHSFEHIRDQQREVSAACSRLAINGELLVRTPIGDSYAWRKYGARWVQLDAPRHMYIHTINSLSRLMAEYRLRLVSVVYDSNSFQFTGSECYQRGFPLEACASMWRHEDVRRFEEQAVSLNAMCDGDSACLIFRKD